MFSVPLGENAQLRPLEPWQAAEFLEHMDRARALSKDCAGVDERILATQSAALAALHGKSYGRALDRAYEALQLAGLEKRDLSSYIAAVSLISQIHLVRGNHDSNRILDLPWAAPPVESMRLTVTDGTGRDRRLFLSHYAHRAWPGLWRETLHLFGHSHGWLPDTSRSCDVGIDACDARPVDLDAILLRLQAAELVPEELARHGMR